MSVKGRASETGSLNRGMEGGKEPLLGSEERGERLKRVPSRFLRAEGTGVSATATIYGPHNGCCGVRLHKHGDLAPRVYRASGRRRFQSAGSSNARPGRGGFHVMPLGDPLGTFHDWITYESIPLGLGVIFAGTALILDRVPHPPKDEDGNKLSMWFFLTAIALGMSTVGRLLDAWLFFALSAVACSDTIAFVEYFLESLEGLLAAATWVFTTKALVPIFLGLSDNQDFWLYHTLYALFVVQATLCLRTLVLRILISGVVRGSFASKIVEVIEFKYVARLLSSPNAWIGNDTEKESEEWELLKHPSPISLVGHMNRSSFWIYDHAGRLLEILDDDDVEILAGAAFDRFVSKGRKARVITIEELDENAEREPFSGKRVGSKLQAAGFGGVTESDATEAANRWAFLKRALSIGRFSAMTARIREEDEGEEDAAAAPVTEDSLDLDGTGSGSAGGGGVHGTGDAATVGRKKFRGLVARALNKVDAEAAKAAADGLEPMLSFDDFSRCFGNDAGQLAVRAWDILETNGDSEISRDEFVAAFLRMYQAFLDARNSLDGGSSIAQVIQSIITVIFALGLLILLLVLYNVDLAAVFLPIGSAILGVSFAFADSVSELVTNISFVLVDTPFDAGDRVLVEGICEDADDVLRVERIGMMSSEFVRKSGLTVQVPNKVLSERAITNFRRSRSAFVQIVLKINFNTPAEKLDKLRDEIFAYVKRNDALWRDEVFILFERLEVGNDLHAKILLSHQLQWQNYPRLKLAESDVNREIMLILNRLGISNEYMSQPVILRHAGPESMASFHVARE